jgi:hypothetical protein
VWSWRSFSHQRASSEPASPSCAQRLVAEGLASHQGQRIVPERDLLTTLTRREFDAAGARRLAETGMPYALVAVLVVSAPLIAANT